MTDKQVLSVTYDPRPEILRTRYDLKEGVFAAHFSFMHLMSTDTLVQVDTAFGPSKRVDHGPLKIYGFYEGKLECDPHKPEDAHISLWPRAHPEDQKQFAIRIEADELKLAQALPAKIENEGHVALSVASSLLTPLSQKWQLCQSIPQESWPLKLQRPNSQQGPSV